MRLIAPISILSIAGAIFLLPSYSLAADDKPSTPKAATSDQKTRNSKTTSPSTIDKFKPAKPGPPSRQEVNLPKTPPPAPKDKLPAGADVNSASKSVTVPVTKDGTNRVGVQSQGKDPTPQNPKGEKGAAVIIEKRF